MGATVTTGKAASAFVRDDGSIIYVLFENTYEKNCYPHTDHWGCIAVGSYADVLKRIFQHAAACEGGGLQSRAGHIKPENYIAAWRRELAAPVSMPDKSINIKTGTSLYSEIPAEKIEDVRLALIRVGREDVFASLQKAHATVSLHKDVDLILALYGTKGFISPWRILDRGDMLTVPQAFMAPSKSIGDVTAPVARVYRLDESNLVVQIGAAPWHQGGWSYSVVGNFITDVAYPLELLQTGSAKDVIGNFRELCKLPALLPSSSRVHVTRSADKVNKWNVEQADKFAQSLGLVMNEEAAPPTFVCSFADVVAAESVYFLTHLDPTQIAWEIPDEMQVSQPIINQMHLSLAA